MRSMSLKAVKVSLMYLALVMCSSAHAEQRSGEEVYKQACSSCHGWIGSMMSDAPRTGDEDAWQILQTKGVDELIKNTINGFGDMPAKGNCVDCSDAEIKAAVELIIERSR